MKRKGNENIGIEFWPVMMLIKAKVPKESLPCKNPTFKRDLPEESLLAQLQV